MDELKFLLDVIFVLALAVLAAYAFYSYYQKNRLQRIDNLHRSLVQPIPDLPPYITSRGHNIAEFMAQNRVMLIFLRHFGCTFCRQTLAFLAEERILLEAKGVQLLFVHPGSPAQADKSFTQWGFPDAHRVTDQELILYNAFGLRKGNFSQLFGKETWIEGFKQGFLKGYGVGIRQQGNGFQMPGVFYIENGIIKANFIHQKASDMPDYMSLLAYSKEYISQLSDKNPLMGSLES